MKKQSTLNLINEKIADVKKVIAATKMSDDISKNTRSTKLYALGKERRVLHLINALIEQLPDEFKLNEDDNDTLVLLTTLSTERTVNTGYVPKEGDNILEALEQYTYLNRKKLEDKCEKYNLVPNYKTGKIEIKK